jgi:archaellum biogenesis ATPase FlaH
MKKKYSLHIDEHYLKSCQKEIELKYNLVEKLANETRKCIHETQENWIDKQISLYFSDDFDLFWTYDHYKHIKDWKSLKRMFEEHKLRVVHHHGRMYNESYLTHVFQDCKLLGTLEIKPPSLKNDFKYEVESKCEQY